MDEKNLLKLIISLIISNNILKILRISNEQI